ncbi:MAG TPA: molecular chaperone [Planctomycetaceae bacterium]|jgi:HSP20 family protein|nr:molecular chaperone [Planctomycetaceae bacterium]
MSTALSNRISRALRPWMRRDPLDSLQEEMDQLLSRLRLDWNGDGPARLAAVPPIDVSETDTTITVRMDVPGWKTEELDIEVSGDLLKISGQRATEKEEKQETCHLVERCQGSFSRAISLPANVSESQITADCQDGVLTVTLPKLEPAKAHKIKIRGNGRPR